MTDLDHFAHWITGGSLEGYPANQKIVFYGVTAPEELSLEEFAEEYKKFILKKVQEMEGKEIEEVVDKILRDLYYEHTDEQWTYFKDHPYQRLLAMNYNELRTAVRLAYVIGRKDEIDSRNI